MKIRFLFVFSLSLFFFFFFFFFCKLCLTLASLIGSYSGTSNSDQCPVMGPSPMVRESHDVSARADWSCSGTSNFGRHPVIGPSPVVQEPHDVSARADWSCSVPPILVCIRSWDQVLWFGNHMTCLQGQIGPVRTPLILVGV